MLGDVGYQSQILSFNAGLLNCVSLGVRGGVLEELCAVGDRGGVCPGKSA